MKGMQSWRLHAYLVVRDLCLDGVYGRYTRWGYPLLSVLPIRWFGRLKGKAVSVRPSVPVFGSDLVSEVNSSVEGSNEGATFR